MPPQSQTPQQPQLKNTTIALMVAVAIVFDAVQWLLAFLFMDWLVGIFAFLTFFVWFKLHRISFMNAKRGGTMGISFLIESIPWLASLPTWTLAVSIIAADVKSKQLTGRVVGGISPKPADNSQSLDKAA